jgi:hypothetical protein
MHRLQLGILLRGLDLLLPGGRLVYSTCSMNPIEDEAVVAAAIAQYNNPPGGAAGAPPARRRARVYLEPTEGMLPGLKRLPGLTSWRVYSNGEFYDHLDAVPAEAKPEKMCSTMFPPPPGVEGGDLGLKRCVRVLPHMQDTGGFFIAVLRKEDGDEGDEEEGAGDERAVNCSGGGEGAAQGGAPAPLDLEAEAKKRDVHGLCFAFQTGSCTRGTRCRYAHLEGECDPPAGDERALGPQHGKAAPHVKGALHCSARNNGKFDSLFSLQDEFVDTVKSFFGLGDSVPGQQLVSRAATGVFEKIREGRPRLLDIKALPRP